MPKKIKMRRGKPRPPSSRAKRGGNSLVARERVRETKAELEAPTRGVDRDYYVTPARQIRR